MSSTAIVASLGSVLGSRPKYVLIHRESEKKPWPVVVRCLFSQLVMSKVRYYVSRGFGGSFSVRGGTRPDMSAKISTNFPTTLTTSINLPLTILLIWQHGYRCIYRRLRSKEHRIFAMAAATAWNNHQSKDTDSGFQRTACWSRSR